MKPKYPAIILIIVPSLFLMACLPPPSSSSTATSTPPSSPPASPMPTSTDDRLKAAWEAFNNKEYQMAITFADKCIEDSGKAADREQERLDKEPLPPTGKVSENQKNKIFERGILNDVATAYFIKGRSAEYLYRKGGSEAATYKEMAEKAYEATCRYKHARTWDPQGWFWSPCHAASDRLPLK